MAYVFVYIALGNKSGIVCQVEDFCYIGWDVYSRVLNSLSPRGYESKIHKRIPVISFPLDRNDTVESNSVILSFHSLRSYLEHLAIFYCMTQIIALISSNLMHFQETGNLR